LTEAPAVDASPLIHLSRSGNLPLLQTLAPALVVPQPVLDEIRAKGEDDATLRALQDTPWLTVVQPPVFPKTLKALDLGQGETSVIAWALSRPGTVAILDDQRARSYAGSLDIPTIGTLGIILRAKRLGVIPLARPVIQDLIARGMYLSKPVVERALGLIGE
jgi:predicted nucleic acid-binding protein